MTGPIHTPEALASFQNGEERLVYARLKGASLETPPYFLADGSARSQDLKQWVREHLECLMPECADRRLIAVNRSEHSGRRDGFSHFRGAGKHGIEGLFHQQGKALIQAWIAERYPYLDARVEEPIAARERVADVMVTWPTGHRVAVEIQYAALTVEEWLERHNSYLRNDIVPIWLLGHHGVHMKAAKGSTDPTSDQVAGQVQLAVLHQKMIEHRAAVLWLNPVDRTVATPWTVIRLGGTHDEFYASCRPDTSRAFLTVENLNDCELDPLDGLITPAHNLISAAQRTYERAFADQKAAAARADADRRAARVAAESRWRRQRAWLADVDARITELHESGDQEWPNCRTCGRRLADILRKSGYHIGCEPPGWPGPESVSPSPGCEQGSLF